ncbi:hypothetical protein [Nostoc sp. ChiSLP03a]|uniref:hypothetical protein n=1 Tax=Nostoc sp. ChiSLP03a TaxID=3075380 RepID=UPI002AD3A4CD|nr:hypothetical protein [Nostoc sp. ChiSLP03a]MDZ8211269.1 hypothetical protein [Nostoc sp. ChiSLP03a]
MLLSKDHYSAKDNHCNLETTTLSQIHSKLAQPPLSQSAEGLQGASIGQNINHGVIATDRTSTLGNWKYQSKIVASSSQRVKAIFEESDNCAVLEFSSQSYSPYPKTHRRIAELGADNETYKYTIEWLDKLRSVVAANQMWWNEPLVNLSLDSEIVLEWWHETKKLTVSILGNTAEYIKVWGTDIDNEMEDGTSSSLAELTDLWKWLSHEDLEDEPRLHRDDKFSVAHKPEVLFSKPIELQTTDLPPWKPRITIDRRMIETEDD